MGPHPPRSTARFRPGLRRASGRSRRTFCCPSRHARSPGATCFASPECRWPMCRVHTARPCTPPQGVDTPQLRRPLRGVCEAIVVRTHHDDRATATPSQAATGARWFPPKRKGGATKAAVAPRTALMARLQCCAGRDGAFVPRSHCGRAPPAPPPLRRMEWRRWRRLRCGVAHHQPSRVQKVYPRPLY